MSNFDRVEFGNNIRKARISKGLSQENLAEVLKVDRSQVARYESGQVLLNAEQIAMICEELEIYESDLYKTTNRKIVNNDNSKNPFGTDTLYIYYPAYLPTKNKYTVGKFKLIIKEKPDGCLVDFVDYKTNKIYSTGYIQADGFIAVLVIENYKPNSPRMEVGEIILNIANGVNDDIIGTYTCTNGQYIPSIRKCLVNKKDYDISENDIKEKLKLTDKELEQAKELDILYLQTRKKEDYED